MDNKLRITLKKAPVLLVLITTAYIAWLITERVSRFGEVRVDVNVAPSTAQVAIDGKKMDSGPVYLKTGSHQIETKLEGFTKILKKYKVIGPQKIDILLSPSGEQGFEYLKANPRLQLEREALGGANFYKAADSFQKKHELILDRLPYTDPLFYISYGSSKRTSNTEGMALYISAYDPFARKLALDTIRDWGYDPSDIEIVFDNNTTTFETQGN